jgi:hypothetical protein
MMVEIKARVGTRLPRGDEDVDGSAEFQQAVAGSDDARGQRRGDEVGGPAHHLRAGGKAGLGGGGGRHLSDHLMRQRARWHRAARQVGQRDQAVVEHAARDVDEACLQRPVLFDAPRARQPEIDVVVGPEDRRDLPEHMRLVALQPAQLGRDQLLVDAVSSPGEEGGRVDLAAQFLDLGGAAPVALLDAGAQRPAVGAEQNDRGQHAGGADRGDVVGRDAGRGAQFAQDAGAVRPPRLGILLGPAGMRRMQRHRPGRDRADPVGQLDQDADRRGGADVEADDAGHREVAPVSAASRPDP